MVSACPEPTQLESFLLGRLPEPDSDSLAEHLDHCSCCLERLGQVRPADGLFRALRGLPAPPFQPVGAATLDLMARLKQLPRQAPEERPVGAEVWPDQLGRYRVLQRLGAGGMGTVYQGHDPDLKRPVALKVPRFEGDPDRQALARQRFLREARAAAAIRHPHICPIYDVGEQDGCPFVVMACVAGPSLAERLQRQGRFDDARAAVRLVAQVARALEEVHAHGIVHRDLKPGNILLDQPDHALLADFGLARTALDDDHLSATGAVLGTPAYMAPEQRLPGAGSVGPAADIYSLGVVLYQLVTGQLPTAEPAPERPSHYRPDLEPGLEQIILQALAAQPDERFRTAGHLAQALEAWLEGPANGWLSVADERLSQLKTLPVRPARRPRWLLLAAGCLLLAGGTLYLAAGGGKFPSNSPLALPGPQAVAPLTGWIDVQVWEPGNANRHNLRLRQPGALPLKAGDQVRIEAELSQPAYVYILWIDTQGKVWPVYPWTPGRWQGRPEDEERVARLSLPAEADAGWPIESGPPGMETLVLLARPTPLPRAVDLEQLLAGLPAQSAQHLQAVAWFENGRVVRQERDRAPNFFNPQHIDDPVLRTQRLLQDRLGPHFPLSRAVSFAGQGR